MNNPTATREELKAILDKWIPKYIRQVVELRSGSRLSAERYNELMNLLITQGDDTIELAQVVKQYVEVLVDEMSTEFATTTDNITNLTNSAISTANNAVNTVESYKTAINQDIAAFKEAVNQVTNTANSNANLALQTANQLVTNMENYRVDLSAQVEETFISMRNTLSTQITDEVSTQMQGIQETLTTDINNTINALSNEVLTIANTAEQTVNTAIQDIESYKANMDIRLDEALKEVENSLSAAGEVIKDAAALYAKLDEINTLVNSYENRVSSIENNLMESTPAVDFAEAATPEFLGSVVELQNSVNNAIASFVSKSDYAPTAKTDSMTQPVGKDATGKLWTAPTGSGGTAVDGKSAYQLAVENGYTGTLEEWLASLNGADGYTPVKGTDYWTAEDKAEIQSYIDTQIGGALNGSY